MRHTRSARPSQQHGSTYRVRCDNDDGEHQRMDSSQLHACLRWTTLLKMQIIADLTDLVTPMARARSFRMSASRPPSSLCFACLCAFACVPMRENFCSEAQNLISLSLARRSLHDGQASSGLESKNKLVNMAVIGLARSMMHVLFRVVSLAWWNHPPSTVLTHFAPAPGESAGTSSVESRYQCPSTLCALRCTYPYTASHNNASYGRIVNL